MQSRRDKRKRYFSRLIMGTIMAALALLPLVLPGPACAEGVTPDVEAGEYHTVVLDSHGRVWVWGDGSSGQLGIGSTSDSAVPVQVTALGGKTITAIAAGCKHTLALDSDGTVWAWGDNISGELGDGSSNNNRTSPVQVSIPAGVEIVALAAGGMHSAALDSSGGVWTWGANDDGELGLGYNNSVLVTVPTQVTVPGGKTITAIAAGYEHTLALASDGTVWAWGNNLLGQLGLNDTADRTSPVQVTMPGDRSIAVIAAGRQHSLAAATDGTVWAWGADSKGQLGDGGTADQHSPVQVNGLSGVTGLKVGSLASMAMRADGTVYNWGSLRTSDGVSVTQTEPVQVGGIDNAADIGIGGGGFRARFFVYKNDGTIWFWGDNIYIGRDGNPYTPGQVIGAVVLSAGNLTETSLDGAQLTLEAVLDSFAGSVDASQFTLNNAPAGTSIAGAALSEGKCILTLAYDGTDFDTDINNLSVTVAGAAVNGSQGMTSNSLAISAVVEPHVTPDQALTEKDLDGRTLTVDLQTGTFSDVTLDAGSFTLNNAPPGLSVAGVNYTGATQCNIILASDGSDFDSDITDCSITIAGGELNDGNPQTTDKFTLTAVQESAAVTPSRPLEENSLNGSLLSVILQNDTFRDNLLDKANFILNNAPAGLGVGSVFYNDSTHCVVTLSYDGAPFSNDINDFSVTIGGAELVSGGDITGSSLTITAQPQALSITTASLPAATVGAAYSQTVQAGGGTAPYAWSAAGLPAGLSQNTVTGEVYGTPAAAGSSQVTFTVTDGNGDRVNKMLTLVVNSPSGSGNYTVTPAADGSYTAVTSPDGTATMTVNSGVAGFKYFTVDIAPTETHNGNEAAVFVHLRNGAQLDINATRADFDSAGGASAGFNVQPGDVINVYVVDNLTGDQNSNPNPL